MQLLGVVFWGALLLVMGCAQAPTLISESDVSIIDRSMQFEKSNRPIKITSETVVLDTRAYFDFQVSHIPNSASINAKEFSLRGSYGSDLQTKGVAIARRLALLGVNPFSHVVVIGYGDKGHGDEGTVAFTLMALGVERVQMGTVLDFRYLLRNKLDKPKPNQRNWEPRIVTSLICSPLSTDAAFVIDVGQAKRTTSLNAKSLATVPIHWKEFVNKEDFSPNYRVKTRLLKDKISENTKVMVSGQQASLVAFSLIQLGYNQVCITE